MLPNTPCDARFAVFPDQVLRLTHLASTLLSDLGTRSEIARGVDGSLAVGQIPSVFVWMPACQSHEGAYSSAAFSDTFIDENGALTSMREAVESFVGMPRYGGVDWRITGTVLGRTMTSTCP